MNSLSERMKKSCNPVINPYTLQQERSGSYFLVYYAVEGKDSLMQSMTEDCNVHKTQT